MSILWLFYGQYYQRVPLERGQQHSLTVGPDVSQMMTVRQFPFTDGILTLEVKDEKFSVWQNGTLIGKANETNSFQLIDQNHRLTIFLKPSDERVQTYYVGYQSEITYSTYDHETQIYHSNPSISETNQSFTLFKLSNGWVVEPRMTNLYLNGKRMYKTTPVEIGDFLFCSFMTFRLLEEDLLEINSIEEYETQLPLTRQPQSVMSMKYPVYRRTPRMIYELPKEKVSLSFPTQESEDTNRGLWLIIMPPLVMLIVMGIVAMIQPRGIYIIVSLVMFIMTLVTSTVQFFKDKGIHKRRKERRRRIYTQYLENKRIELQELSEQQKKVLHFHFPSFERMKYLTHQISDRLWERSLESYDFLQFRLGTGKVSASYEISLHSGDMANREMDDLLEQSQAMEKVYREIQHVPIVANLSQGSDWFNWERICL